MRAAILVVAVILIGGATLALWVTGGLASAHDKPPSPPGTKLKNDLFTVTLHEARIVTGGEQLTGAGLEVSADIVSHHDEPVAVADAMRMLEPTFPSKKLEAKNGGITFERHPQGTVQDLQPKMPEKVRITWTIGEPGSGDSAKDISKQLEKALEEPSGPNLAPLAKKQEHVTVTVTEAELKPGFTDQSERWFTADKNAGRVRLPLGQG